MIIKKKKIILCWVLYCLARKYKKARTKYHVHPLKRLRKSHGEYYNLMKQLELYPPKFYQYFRMNKTEFEFVLQKIHQIITPRRSNFRKDIISSEEKLVITLRFLATGASFTDLALRFLMGITTVRRCIVQTIIAINQKLKSIMLPKPTNSNWQHITEDFYRRWNFPNCLGAVNGKHIQMFSPGNSGSLYYNYKKTFSIGLMAVVDAQYKFIMVNIGSYGSNSDSAVFSNCNFGKAWIKNPKLLNVPKDACLPGTNSLPVPHVLVGDEGFGLKLNLLTPYPGQKLSIKQRLFNYRLSRARRIVENSFGILCHTWRILLKSLEIQVPFAKQLVLSCCILHNFLRCRMSKPELFPEETDSEKISEVFPDPDMENECKPASFAYEVREIFAEWCLNEGDVPFQHDMI